MTSITVNNPYDDSALRQIELMQSDEVEQALSTAHSLFNNRSARMPAHQRIKILERCAEIMRSQVEELTNLAASEGGKPYVDSKVEVLRAINGVELAIEHIAHIKGEQIPMGHTESSAQRMAFTSREPIGVVASISAFNHPLNLIVHQTVPAIAVGCPVIVKPAGTTPLSCLRLVEILHEAGLPAEWCQAVVCSNEDAEKLVTDPRIAYFSFIGSGRVGWMLRSKLSPGVRCALEHGGVAPAIVHPSADIDVMLSSVLKGGFYHAGQVCVSVQRLFLPSDLSQEVAQRLADKAGQLKVGDPLDPSTEVGPLITHREVDRVAEWVEEARAAGGKILCGGEKISASCYAPTVVLDPPETVRLSKEEVFGPVVCVYSYDSLEEAIARSNNVPFAFQASIFTNDLESALKASSELNATAVMINDHTAFRVDWMPFGGRSVSGIGMGGIPYSMHEMTQEKMIVIKSDVFA